MLMILMVMMIVVDGDGVLGNHNGEFELFHLPLSQKNIKARPASLGGNFDIFLRRHRDNE